MKQIEQKILSYCSEEGIGYIQIPENNNLEFGINIKFPPHHPKPKGIAIIQPKNKSFIVLQIGIQISDEHLKALENQSPNAKMVFFEMIRRNLLAKDLMFKMEIKHNRFLITEQIYEDGLSMDSFFRNIRRIINASDTCNLILSDISSGRGIQMIPKKSSQRPIKDDDDSYNNLYYS